MSEKTSPDQVDSSESRMDSQQHGYSADSDAASAIKENLSALMDGEANEMELRRVLKQVSTDNVDDAETADLQDVWRRYHMVSDVLHHDIHTKPEVNLLSGIQAKLATEQIDHSKTAFGRSFGGMMKRVGQTAIAASVAFTVLYSGSYVQSVVFQESQEGATVASNVVNAGSSGNLPVLGGDFTPSNLSRTVSMDDAAKQRLQRAVVSQFSANRSTQTGTAYTFPLEEEALAADIEANKSNSQNNTNQ